MGDGRVVRRPARADQLDGGGPSHRHPRPVRRHGGGRHPLSDGVPAHVERRGPADLRRPAPAGRGRRDPPGPGDLPATPGRPGVQPRAGRGLERRGTGAAEPVRPRRRCGRAEHRCRAAARRGAGERRARRGHGARRQPGHRAARQVRGLRDGGDLDQAIGVGRRVAALPAADAPSFLPVHAARHHNTRDTERPRTVLDRVVSSYAPTVRALPAARARRPAPGAPRPLAVGVPGKPGELSALAHARAEAEMVGRRFRGPGADRRGGDAGACRPRCPAVRGRTSPATASPISTTRRRGAATAARSRGGGRCPDGRGCLPAGPGQRGAGPSVRL